jgi:hypothetical protein
MPQPDNQSHSQSGITSSDRHHKAMRCPIETEPSTNLPSTTTSPTPRNPANRLWTETNQRDRFVQHLANWASHHDSSTYFHGKISLHPQGALAGEVVELGKSVNCILTDTSSPDVGKAIVIRLFQSPRYNDSIQGRREYLKRSSITLSGASNWGSTSVRQNSSGHGGPEPQQGHSNWPYKLVIRSGSGWVSAREYLNRHYFSHLARRNATVWIHELRDPTKKVGQDLLFRTRLMQLGSAPFLKEAVTIHPLFHPFRRLPPELQDSILHEAVGYTRTIRLVRDSSTYLEGASGVPTPPITISKLFLISKAINEHMIPYIFQSTNFHFGITGFTNFLWQLGPVNRSKLQHLTFHFGKVSLLHCIRWLAPDPVYELFEPPVVTSPVNLTYFWRCQIQDLMKELNLLTLTVDIRNVPQTDLPMYFRILSTVFGSVKRIRVVETQSDGSRRLVGTTQDLMMGDLWGASLTWRDMSMGYYRHYRNHAFYMRRVWQIHTDECDCLQRWMESDKAFFDS